MHDPIAMPISTDHNDTVLQVMHAHDISQADLARACGLSPGTISRVCSGQLAVTPPVTQALWRLTGDPRIVQVALGVPDAVVLDAAQASVGRPDVDAAACIIACNHASTRIADTTRDQRCPREDNASVKVIDNAIGHLLNIRSRVARGQTVPFVYRQARALPDHITA